MADTQAVVGMQWGLRTEGDRLLRQCWIPCARSSSAQRNLTSSTITLFSQEAKEVDT